MILGAQNCSRPAGLLDDRVSPVVGLDVGHRQVSVGDESVVVPGGEQRELRPGCRTDPAHLAGVVAGEDGDGVSAMSVPSTWGVVSQYGIGCQPDSSIASIAARVRLSCRAVMENRTSDLVAVASIALE